jgi:hypothetical protein
VERGLSEIALVGDLRGSIGPVEYCLGGISRNPYTDSGSQEEQWPQQPEISIKIVRVVIVCMVSFISLFVTVIIISSIYSINVSAALRALRV